MTTYEVEYLYFYVSFPFGLLCLVYVKYTFPYLILALLLRLLFITFVEKDVHELIVFLAL